MPDPDPALIRRFVSLAEAYPCTVGSYPPGMGIADQRVFTGHCPPQAAVRGATPGILSLARQGLQLDVNCFAITPFGEVGPCMVQSYNLRKIVPGSRKCPDVYPPQAHLQFGTGVRTWWSLNFTQPGTLFILDVVSVCRKAVLPGVLRPSFHRDVWVWQVVADINTLEYVIELMHSGAVSILEVPCILGEDMYDALKAARQRIADAIPTEDPVRIGNAIFDMEVLILANCLSIDVLNPIEVFPGEDQFGAPNYQPPGNLAQTVTLAGGRTAVAGIIDTVEHPCCCKLIVDLESITFQLGLPG
jgi:hypothetical protein